MLIIPLTGKISWKNPPYLTLFLILANCFVFFVFQTSENRRQMEAFEFYARSGLAEIEIPAYLDYLEHHFPALAPESSPDLSDENTLCIYSFEIMNDAPFLKKLLAGGIITEEHDQHEEWNKLRTEFNGLLSRVVSWRFGFKPGFPDGIAFFTHMFLHGGIGHLVGNMIFLWLAGCLVESGMRRQFFLPAYVLTGFSAAAFFWACNRATGLPMVGASGAISGLMGMMATLYGKNRIRVFYSLGVYFNYVKAPAILLLPIWIGKELAAFFWGEPSAVAYMAHVGGFAGGGLIGLLSRFVLHIDNAAAIEEPPEDRTAVHIEQALKALGEMNIQEALEILEDALKESPDNLEIIEQQYKIAKMNPESALFHATAVDLLRRYSTSPALYEQAGALFEDYFKTAARTRLPLKIYVRLAFVFISLGNTASAEKIMNMFLKKKIDIPELPVIMLKLGQAFKTSGDLAKYEQYHRLLTTRFPDSREALMIGESS